MLPEGTVQALATKLEEGQVLLSHSPAEVITVEGSGDQVWVEGLGRGHRYRGNPGPAHILRPKKWGWGPQARQRPSQLDLGSRECRGGQVLVCTGTRPRAGWEGPCSQGREAKGRSSGSKLGQRCGEARTPV